MLNVGLETYEKGVEVGKLEGLNEALQEIETLAGDYDDATRDYHPNSVAGGRVRAAAEAVSACVSIVMRLISQAAPKPPAPVAPEVGTYWWHHSGRRYHVVGITNQGAPSDKFPVTVVYQDCESSVARTWSRPLSEWVEKFVPDAPAAPVAVS